jgi:hypothetical protein
MKYQYQKYGCLRVAWTEELDGGGRDFGQQYTTFVQKRIGKTERLFEFCAGPGFIGFSLLARGLCKSLCLADVNPDAVRAIEHTIGLNALGDRVSVYLADALYGIPDHEQWDLVVGNPPHYSGVQTGDGGLLRNDPEWSVHRRFYANVRRHLNPYGRCVVQENYLGSSQGIFLGMLEGTGLEYDGSFMVAEGSMSPLNTFYFFCTRVRHDVITAVDSGPVRRIELCREADGSIAVRNAEHNEPLTLSIGQKYGFCVADGAALAVSVRCVESASAMQATIPAVQSACGQSNQTDVLAIPTCPCRIADPLTGIELVRFV